MISATQLGLAAAAVAIASSALSGWVSYGLGQDSIQMKWDASVIAAQDAALKREAEYRSLEKQSSEAVANVADNLYKQNLQIQQEYEAVISDLNDGTLVLRERFRGCQSRLSESAKTASGDDGKDRRGLLRGDQEHLLRVGRSCNATVSKLTACQNYVRSLAGICY